MKTKITLSIIIAALFAITVNSFAANVTIRFKAPASWTTANMYVWGTSEVMGAWPGQPATKDADGIYSITYDNTGITVANGIFNNGVEQTASFNVLSNSCWETTTLTGTEYAVAAMACPNADVVRVHFKAPADWANVFFYIWGTNNSLVGGWPGTKMTMGTDGLYSGQFDKTGILEANGIFNNNAGIQTASINVLGGGCFEATTLAGAEYAVVSVTCNTTGVSEKQNKQTVIQSNLLRDILNLSSTENVNNINIYSSTGENVMKASNLSRNAAIDVSSIKPGIYFVNFIFADGKRTIEKIIKL